VCSSDLVILVHNYQRPEIYKIADFIGDSLELSIKAAETDADMIVFCGVDFMAESAKVLNPEKKVLIPVKDAVCPMAGMVSRKQLSDLKKQYPKAAVVSYITTTAETKAESDICCTSANAVKIVNSMPNKEIIFLPDENLAKYIQSKSDKKIIPWKGFCYVHANITVNQVLECKRNHPDAKVLVHPECTMDVIKLADFVCSTSQMLYHAKEDETKKFIVVTENGMVERLKLEIPEKEFYMIGATCAQMKLTTLSQVLKSLQKEIHLINLEKELLTKARIPLDKMMAASKNSSFVSR
jgi:quinolinate synthase